MYFLKGRAGDKEGMLDLPFCFSSFNGRTSADSAWQLVYMCVLEFTSKYKIPFV